MKIIDWNISWANAVASKIEYLKSQLSDEAFVIILQEVTPTAHLALVESFENIAHVEYSLSFRKPSKRDSTSRKLGIAILTSSHFAIKSANVLPRALMPDRTLLLDVDYQGRSLRILGLHSITGCAYGKAKEIQYDSFAEAIDEYKPDVVGIDANEPQIDHYDIKKMKFFDNGQGGQGCRSFFEALYDNQLSDIYSTSYNPDNYIEGECLATSHIIKRGKKRVRYDFIFSKSEALTPISCTYDYDKATEAGSDHAAVIATFTD